MTESSFDMPEPSRLMLAGDWHGNEYWAKQIIRKAHANKCKAILQLGDFGYWPTYSDSDSTSFLDGLNEELKGLPLYWLDGNHEHHDLLTPGMKVGSIQHLPRGHRWQWWGKTWMAIGGGVSVDKKFRTAGQDWFPEETLTPVQFEHCMREGDVDVIVSHDAPSGVLIPGVHALQKQGKEQDGTILTKPWFPVEQLYESEAHRGLLKIIGEEKLPAYWFHGHYHSRYNGPWKSEKWIEGGPATLIVGLADDNNGNWTTNAIVITEKDLV